MTTNNEIREQARTAGVRHWQIANAMGVSEQTLVRWLRTPLDESKRQRITAAIEQLTAGETEVS